MTRPVMTRTLMTLGAGALLTLAWAPDAALAQSGPVYDPAAFGPYGVGVMEVTVKARHQRGEELHGLMWYPAEVEAGGEPYVYLLGDDGSELSFTAVEGRAPSEAAGVSPGVVFSHGNGGLAYQSVFYTEHLASHGFVVISVDHPGNTMFEYDPTTIVTGLWTRPMDVSAELDYLVRTNAEVSSPFFRKIDVDHLGVSGHSYGGYTTLVSAGAELSFSGFARACAGQRGVSDEDAAFACQVVMEAESQGLGGARSTDLSDPRLSAAVPMAPWVRPGIMGGLDGIDIPTQIQAGDRDTTCPVDSQARPAYEGASGPTALLDIFDAGHYAWSDICELEPGFDDCSPPYLDMALAHEVINIWATSFLKVHLAQDDRYASYLTPSAAAAYSDVLSYETR